MMQNKTLAVKYRPKTFDDVIEQDSIKVILQQQLATGTTKNAYLFVGGAGTGKTTCARILANELNKHIGNPIELDAASNNSVDDVRNISQQARTKSIDSEYKVFIIDECHALSSSAWQAMLKLIEEPPAKSVFIFCTTDSQKIPKTILSRVQRYDFKRISQNGIVNRLMTILITEQELGHDEEHAILYTDDAVKYIAKLADGGMRDAISLMDKCLSYSSQLTVDNIIQALGVVDFEVFRTLTDALLNDDYLQSIDVIENLYHDGKNLKQFVKSYLRFLLDVLKHDIECDWKYLDIPRLEENEIWLDNHFDKFDDIQMLTRSILKLNADIKWSDSPRQDIELMMFNWR